MPDLPLFVGHSNVYKQPAYQPWIEFAKFFQVQAAQPWVELPSDEEIIHPMPCMIGHNALIMHYVANSGDSS